MNSSANSLALANPLITTAGTRVEEPQPGTGVLVRPWGVWVHTVLAAGALLSGLVFGLQVNQIISANLSGYFLWGAGTLLLASLYVAFLGQRSVQPAELSRAMMALGMVGVSCHLALASDPSMGLVGALMLFTISAVEISGWMRHVCITKVTSGKLAQIFESKFPVLKVLSDVGTLELRGGAWIRVGAGERVPVDGSVISGEGVLSGCVGAGYLGARVCRVGDSVSAGELLEEGTLAIAVERSWPYHRCAARARFAEAAASLSEQDIEPREQLPTWFAAATIILTTAGIASGHSELAAYCGCLALGLYSCLQYPDSRLYAMVVATAYRAGVSIRSQLWVRDIAACDGVVIAPEAFEAPVVRRRAVLSSAIDADHLDAVLVNLLGAAPDGWARTLTTYLKDRTKKLSHLCGVKGYRRLSAGGIRGEFEGAQIVVGDEATIRAQGIPLEVSEAQPAASGTSVILVAVAGEVVERFELEPLPTAEFNQQAAREFDRGLFAEMKPRQRGRWVGDPPPGDGFLIRASTALGTISLAEAMPDHSGHSAAQQELFSRDDIAWRENEVLRLLVPEGVLKILPIIRRCKLLESLRDVLVACSVVLASAVVGVVGMLTDFSPVWTTAAVCVIPLMLVIRDLFALLVAAERL